MTARRAPARRATALVVMAAGALVAFAGSLLPWLRTGSAHRNSYEVFAIVDRLGFAPDAAVAQGLRWWPLVPLLAATAVVVTWWGWPRTGGAVGIVAGLYAGGVGAAVTAADASDLVDIRFGAAVTAAGGLVLLLGAVGAVVVGTVRPTDRGRRAGP